MWCDSLFPKEWTIRKSSRLPTLFLEEESASNCHLTGWDTSCPNMHANMRSPHAKGRHSSCHHTKTNRAPQAGDYSTHLRVEAFRLQLMLQEVFMPYLFFFFPTLIFRSFSRFPQWFLSVRALSEQWPPRAATPAEFCDICLVFEETEGSPSAGKGG